MFLRSLLIMLLTLSGGLSAVTAEYNIKSLGMNFARLSLNIDGTKRTISIIAKSVQTGNILAKLDNSYYLRYDQEFRPLFYQRQIKQKKLETKVITRYDHAQNSATMHDSASEKLSSYHLPKGSRDIFSFLAFCAQGSPQAGFYPIDANGSSWQAKLSHGTKEQIKTPLGKFDTIKYTLDFRQSGAGKTAYVDMVTFNLVNSQTRLELWVSDQGIPLKARVKKGSQTMNWDLAALKP